MLADKLLQKTAEEYSPDEIAAMMPDAPGSGSFGAYPDPTILGTVARSGGTLGAAYLLSKGGKALKGSMPRTGGAMRGAGMVVLPALAVLWALNRHLGTSASTERALKERAKLVKTGGPSWLQGADYNMVQFRNKLLDQERKLNKLIATRFKDRGDGTFYDTATDKIVTSGKKDAAIGQLHTIAQNERERLFADMSAKMNAGQYMYDPITKTVRLVKSPNQGTPADAEYQKFRDVVRRQAANKGRLGSLVLPYTYNNGRFMTWAGKSDLSEDDIRRMYMQYLGGSTRGYV